MKLVDFGIAKVLLEAGGDDGAVGAPGPGDAALDGATGRRLTWAYASPEQVRGEAPAASTDVYALGVLLYELLAGRRPYEVGGLPAERAAEVILAHRPEPPGTVAQGPRGKRFRRRLEGDLDAICLKALEKEPQRRYATVGQLGEDVRRHLEGFPRHGPAGHTPLPGWEVRAKARDGRGGGSPHRAPAHRGGHARAAGKPRRPERRRRRRRRCRRSW